MKERDKQRNEINRQIERESETTTNDNKQQRRRFLITTATVPSFLLGLGAGKYFNRHRNYENPGNPWNLFDFAVVDRAERGERS